jgi:hypothetical protein
LPRRGNASDLSLFDRRFANAIRQAEFRATRKAYSKQPDSAVDADDWSTAE